MNKRELVRLHKRLCKELGVKPCRLIFRKKSRRNWAAVYHEHLNTITLYGEEIKRSGYLPEVVLAHEVRHLYQHQTGICSGTSWRGKSYEDAWDRTRLYGVGYNNLPWERDANRWAWKIAKREGWV